MPRVNYLGPTYNCAMTLAGEYVHNFKPGSAVCTCGKISIGLKDYILSSSPYHDAAHALVAALPPTNLGDLGGT